MNAHRERLLNAYREKQIESIRINNELDELLKEIEREPCDRCDDCITCPFYGVTDVVQQEGYDNLCVAIGECSLNKYKENI